MPRWLVLLLEAIFPVLVLPVSILWIEIPNFMTVRSEIKRAGDDISVPNFFWGLMTQPYGESFTEADMEIYVPKGGGGEPISYGQHSFGSLYSWLQRADAAPALFL